MPFHLHILNLRSDVTNKDVRKLFSGLAIKDDGVIILGGSKGEAFVSFENETALIHAVQKDGDQHLELKIADDMDKLKAINRMCTSKLQTYKTEERIETKHHTHPIPISEAKSQQIMQRQDLFTAEDGGYKPQIKRRKVSEGKANTSTYNESDCKYPNSPAYSDEHETTACMSSNDYLYYNNTTNVRTKEKLGESEKLADSRPSGNTIVMDTLISKKEPIDQNNEYKYKSDKYHNYEEKHLTKYPYTVKEKTQSGENKPQMPETKLKQTEGLKNVVQNNAIRSDKELPSYSDILNMICKKPIKPTVKLNSSNIHVNELPLPESAEQSSTSRYYNVLQGSCLSANHQMIRDPSNLPHYSNAPNLFNNIQPTCLQNQSNFHNIPYPPPARYAIPANSQAHIAPPNFKPAHIVPEHSVSKPYRILSSIPERIAPVPYSAPSKSKAPEEVAAAFSTGMARNLEQGTDLVEPLMKPGRQLFHGSLFKTLSTVGPTNRPERYNIFLTDLPPYVTVHVIFKWVGGLLGTSLGVILIKPTNDRPVAFVVYDDVGERDNAMQLSGTWVEPYSDDETLHFIRNFVTNWFRWKGNKVLNSPITEITGSGVESMISFKDMQKHAYTIMHEDNSTKECVSTQAITKPLIVANDKVKAGAIKIDINQTSLSSGKIPLKETNELTTTQETSITIKEINDPILPKRPVKQPFGGSLFKSLHVQNRASYYNILLTDLPKKISAAKMYNWLDVNSRVAIGVIVLRSPMEEPVAFMICENEQERDETFATLQGMIEAKVKPKMENVKAEVISDADTIKLIMDFIPKWFYWKGDKSINSPITETNSARCDNYVKFEDMQLCAMGKLYSTEADDDDDDDDDDTNAWKKSFNLISASKLFYIELKDFTNTYSANEIWSWFPKSQGVITVVDESGHTMGATIGFTDSMTRYDAARRAENSNKTSPKFNFLKTVATRKASAFIASTAVQPYQIRVSTTSDKDRVIIINEAKWLVDLKAKSNIAAVQCNFSSQGADSFIHILRNKNEYWDHEALFLAVYKLSRTCSACDILSQYPGAICAAKLNHHKTAPNTEEAIGFVFFRDLHSRELAKVIINCGENIGRFKVFERLELEQYLARTCHTGTISESTSSGVDKIVEMHEFELEVTNEQFNMADGPFQYLQMDTFGKNNSASNIWYQRGERTGAIKAVILVSTNEDLAQKAFFVVDTLKECRNQAKRIINNSKLRNGWQSHLVSRNDVIHFLKNKCNDHIIKVSTETGQDRLLEPEELSYITDEAISLPELKAKKYYGFQILGLNQKCASEMLSFHPKAKSATVIRDSNGVSVYALITYDSEDDRKFGVRKYGTIACSQEGWAVHLTSFESDYVVFESSGGEDQVMTIEERAFLDK